jgi:NADP-dependent alcohol dehydrogenase
MIGHELTAMYGIDHARTFSCNSTKYIKLCLKPKEKLAQYGKRIFNLTGTDDEIANEAIAKTVEFFHTMGMDTKLSDYTKDYDKTADFIVNRRKRLERFREKQNITLDKVKSIVEMSY